MARTTSIEWTDRTWNPLIAVLTEDITVPLKGGKTRVFPAETEGWFCTKCSEGCANCYAEKINFRLGNGLTYTVGNLAKIRFELRHLAAPLRWKKPSRVFVNSMTDLFHDAVPDSLIDAVFAAMALAPHQTFQVLTKRAQRMRNYFAAADVWQRIDDAAPSIAGRRIDRTPTPLPNVWLGVSVENQKRADERIPHLLETPAAVRFLSCEPLLGPLSLSGKLCDWTNDDGTGSWFSPVPGKIHRRFIHWVIAGGESGPKARPMHPDWARSLRDQCAAAGVPFLFKQWGEWLPGCQYREGDRERLREKAQHSFSLDDHSWLVGKKAAGRLLDGREHDEFPKEGRPA